MAHIFFERLENRRSTQSLYGGYTTPYNEIATYYGVAVALYGISNPNPYPSINYTPQWNLGGYYPYYNPTTFYSPFSGWNMPFNQYSWTNPFSSLFGGISNIFSPFLNNFRGIFGWQSPTWPIYSYPGYTNPGSIFPGEIRALYAAPTSYTPPDYSNPWLLYGIGIPSSYSTPSSGNFYAYAVGLPIETSRDGFKI